MHKQIPIKFGYESYRCVREKCRSTDLKIGEEHELIGGSYTIRLTCNKCGVIMDLLYFGLFNPNGSFKIVK